jgi:hypothetical protein
MGPIPLRQSIQVKRMFCSWERCSDSCLPMVNFAEIWANDLDHDDNYFMFERETNRSRIVEFLNFAEIELDLRSALKAGLKADQN